MIRRFEKEVNHCKEEENKLEEVEFPSGLLILPNAFITKIEMECCKQVGDHFEFVTVVHGCTRFWRSNGGGEDSIQYTVQKRYSEFRLLHQELSVELAPVLKLSKCPMPKFPSKTWLSAGRKVSERRLILFQDYFQTLFSLCQFQMRYSHLIT